MGKNKPSMGKKQEQDSKNRYDALRKDLEEFNGRVKELYKLIWPVPVFGLLLLLYLDPPPKRKRFKRRRHDADESCDAVSEAVSEDDS